MVHRVALSVFFPRIPFFCGGKELSSWQPLKRRCIVATACINVFTAGNPFLGQKYLDLVKRGPKGLAKNGNG